MEHPSMNPLKRHLLLALPTVLLLSAAIMAAEANAPVSVAEYKPPIRVACLGDSITHGVGAATGWAWPDQLDRMLGPAWDVRNYGHSGASIAKEEKHTIWKPEGIQRRAAFPSRRGNHSLGHERLQAPELGTQKSSPSYTRNWRFPSRSCRASPVSTAVIRPTWPGRVPSASTRPA